MNITGFEIDIDYSQASCAKVEDPEVFFPDGGADHWDKVAEAKAICATCPVIDQCLQHGANFEKVGIWGGLTPSELEQYRKDNGIIRQNVSKDFSPEADLRAGEHGEPVVWRLLEDSFI